MARYRRDGDIFAAKRDATPASRVYGVSGVDQELHKCRYIQGDADIYRHRWGLEVQLRSRVRSRRREIAPPMRRPIRRSTSSMVVDGFKMVSDLYSNPWGSVPTPGASSVCSRASSRLPARAGKTKDDLYDDGQLQEGLRSV